MQSINNVHSSSMTPKPYTELTVIYLCQRYYVSVRLSSSSVLKTQTLLYHAWLLPCSNCHIWSFSSSTLLLLIIFAMGTASLMLWVLYRMVRTALSPWYNCTFTASPYHCPYLNDLISNHFKLNKEERHIFILWLIDLIWYCNHGNNFTALIYWIK